MKRLLLALLCLVATGCGDAAPLRFQRVVLVTLDTLRADHLGPYGYPRATSPFLDELASRGVVFERAYAPMATTAPSHASIFTSLYPLEHGVVSNGRRLGASFPTLAQRLRTAGFRTAGFVSTHAHWRPLDLDRGFETFDARPRESGEVYRTADRTVDAALEWVSGCSDCERLLLFVHLFDAHAPLRPPERHLDVFRSAAPGDRLEHAEFLEASHRVPIAFYGEDPGRMLFIMDRYDAEVRFVDEQLRRLYEGLASRGLADATLWVVTADHGEGLGNHRWMGHGQAYEESLRVPLIFHAPDGRLASRRVASIVEHVDLLPTVLALVEGVEASDDPISGRSLVPLLRGEPPRAPRAAFGQRGAIPREDEVRRLPQEDPGDLDGQQFALTEARWKLLQHTAGPDRLYDLASDPYESRDLLAEGEAPQAERLRRALDERLRSLRRTTPLAPEVDSETAEELRALGYVP
jgi:arylsulfatase A-like enzyme